MARRTLRVLNNGRTTDHKPKPYELLAQAVLIQGLADIHPNLSSRKIGIFEDAKSFFTEPNFECDYWIALSGTDPNKIKKNAQYLIDHPEVSFLKYAAKFLKYMDRESIPA